MSPHPPLRRVTGLVCHASGPRLDRDLGLEIGMRSNPRQLHPSILYHI